MATSTGKKRKRPPRVEVRNRGKVSATLEGIAEEFQKDNPELKCRWVYSPEHKPDLSNVIGRKAQGYRVVVGKDSSMATEMLGLEPDEKVRVGDVILMAIPLDEYREIEADLRARAEAEKDRVSHEYYEATERIATAGMRPEHKPRPRGRAVIEERDFEFEVEQGTSTEE